VIIKAERTCYDLVSDLETDHFSSTFPNTLRREKKCKRQKESIRE